MEAAPASIEGALLLTEVQLRFSGVGVEDGITPPSHLWRGELVAIVVQETLKEEQTVSPSVA